jgi:arylsulfatase
MDDPGETRDLAQEELETLKNLLDCWDEYVAECSIVWGEQAMNTPGLSQDETPELWEDEMDLQKT